MSTKTNTQKRSSLSWFYGIIVFLFLIVSLSTYIIYSIINITRYNDLNSLTDKILLYSHKSTIAAKEFLMNAYTDERFVKNGTSISYKNFVQNTDTVSQLVKEFQTSWFIDNNKQKSKVDSLNKAIADYKKDFNEVGLLFKEKGFKDLGLEGVMRKAIHSIEFSKASLDQEYMLTLRRHEKDFLLRKDESYINKFIIDLISFEDYISTNTSLNDSIKDFLIQSLHDYESAFKQIVAIEKNIGLTPEEGIRLKLSLELKKIESILHDFSSEIKTIKNKATAGTNITVFCILILFVFILVSVLFGYRYYVKSIEQPIQKLNDAADQISEGNLSFNFEDLKTKKLLGELVGSFEKIIQKFRFTIQQIESISSRKILATLDLNSNNDEIGKSLNKIIGELINVDKEEESRIWVSEGITKFSEIIRENHDLQSLCSNLTSNVVKYLNANQAGLFLKTNESGHDQLVLFASYAYNRKKYLNKTIEPGEGLVGQCFLEMESIYINDVPENYIRITSGLGDAPPRALLVTPLIQNDVVEGVIEIASFAEFTPNQIQFVEKVAEMVASSLYAIKNNEMTMQLLSESKIQTEQMKMQEEEMRQNMEELIATQEENLKKQFHYEEKITVLENELLAIKQYNQKLAMESHRLDLVFGAKEKDLKKSLDEINHLRNQIYSMSTFPKRREYSTES